MPYRPKPTGPSDPFTTTEKVMQTFRLPRELVTFLKADAARTGLDVTAYVHRMLDGVRTYYGLPLAVTQLLEPDRAALKMQRYEYFQHLVFQRSMQLREKGPGFDALGGGEKKKR